MQTYLSLNVIFDEKPQPPLAAAPPVRPEPYERSPRQSRDIAQAIEDWCHTVQAGEQT